MKYNDFLELAQTRRTIRKFKTDPVSDEDVDNIIEAARWAPSGFNSQPWEFAVVKDPASREVVLKHLLEHMPPPSVKGMPRPRCSSSFSATRESSPSAHQP
jgi:nitroreductase